MKKKTDVSSVDEEKAVVDERIQIQTADEIATTCSSPIPGLSDGKSAGSNVSSTTSIVEVTDKAPERAVDEGIDDVEWWEKCRVKVSNLLIHPYTEGVVFLLILVDLVAVFGEIAMHVLFDSVDLENWKYKFHADFNFEKYPIFNESLSNYLIQHPGEEAVSKVETWYNNSNMNSNKIPFSCATHGENFCRDDFGKKVYHMHHNLVLISYGALIFFFVEVWLHALVHAGHRFGHSNSHDGHHKEEKNAKNDVSAGDVPVSAGDVEDALARSQGTERAPKRIQKQKNTKNKNKKHKRVRKSGRLSVSPRFKTMPSSRFKVKIPRLIKEKTEDQKSKKNRRKEYEKRQSNIVKQKERRHERTDKAKSLLENMERMERYGMAGSLETKKESALQRKLSERLQGDQNSVCNGAKVLLTAERWIHVTDFIVINFAIIMHWLSEDSEAADAIVLVL